jgi:hypothetical protein
MSWRDFNSEEYRNTQDLHLKNPLRSREVCAEDCSAGAVRTDPGPHGRLLLAAMDAAIKAISVPGVSSPEAL